MSENGVLPEKQNGLLPFGTEESRRIDEFMREWLLRQQELHAGEVTREEYFEWKLNWPCTCDEDKERQHYIPWRKNK